MTHDLLALSEKQRRATMNIMNRLSRQTSRVDGKTESNPMQPLAEALEAAVMNGSPPEERSHPRNGEAQHNQVQYPTCPTHCMMARQISCHSLHTELSTLSIDLAHSVSSTQHCTIKYACGCACIHAAIEQIAALGR